MSNVTRKEVSIDSIPAEAAVILRVSSPAVSTVTVERFERKGVEYLLYAAAEGSPDGFPFVTVKA